MCKERHKYKQLCMAFKGAEVLSNMHDVKRGTEACNSALCYEELKECVVSGAIPATKYIGLANKI